MDDFETKDLFENAFFLKKKVFDDWDVLHTTVFGFGYAR